MNRPNLSELSRDAEITELLAKTIYESVFEDRWVGGARIESALYRQAARNVLAVLGKYVLEVAPHRKAPQKGDVHD